MGGGIDKKILKKDIFIILKGLEGDALLRRVR